MNISGILVVVAPERLLQTVAALTALPGVEVHHTDDAGGRIVVTQEATSIGAEVEGLKRIKALPNILVAELAYHYFAEDDEVIHEIPVQLDELQGLPLAPVPSFLNE